MQTARNIDYTTKFTDAVSAEFLRIINSEDINAGVLEGAFAQWRHQAAQLKRKRLDKRAGKVQLTLDCAAVVC